MPSPATRQAYDYFNGGVKPDLGPLGADQVQAIAEAEAQFERIFGKWDRAKGRHVPAVVTEAPAQARAA